MSTLAASLHTPRLCCGLTEMHATFDPDFLAALQDNNDLDHSSGFASCATSSSSTASSDAVTNSSSSPETVPDSIDSKRTGNATSTYRRSSSGQKLARFIHALTPCRGRVARRSHSFGNLSKSALSHGSSWDPITLPTTLPLSPSVFTGLYSQGCELRSAKLEQSPILPVKPHFASTSKSNTTTSSIPSAPAPCAVQMDLATSAVTANVLEFRRRWPASFATLISNYLGYLLFTPEDMENIRDALTREAKRTTPISVELEAGTTSGSCLSSSSSTTTTTTTAASSCNTSSSSATTNSSTWRSFTPQKIIRSRDRKNNDDKDLDHWFAIVNAMLLHLLQRDRYKHRFIFRRPGNHSTVNELERVLLPPRRRPLSVNMLKSRPPVDLAPGSIDRLPTSPTSLSDVVDILERHDSTTVACLLARVLRRQGVGLFPAHLRGLFLQLIGQPTEVRQRRASRLLFQLFPRRTLRYVVQPLFHLLASVANESQCDVDPTSLSVLFAPILFTDRATTTPAALANPLPARAVEMLVRMAQRELCEHHSVDGLLFHVPQMFSQDCAQNLQAFSTLDNPPLTCSLKYCVTMTPSPRAQGKKPDATVELFPTGRDNRSHIPKVNLTTAFMAKRPRARSPFMAGDYQTPVLKHALHSPTLDFRVRRTPTNQPTGRRIACIPATYSPLSSLDRGSDIRRHVTLTWSK